MSNEPEVTLAVFQSTEVDIMNANTYVGYVE